MASGVNVFDVTISTSGVLNLSQGSGIYRVETFGGTASDTIEEVTGAAHPHIYELRIKTPGHYWTINHDPAKNIFLMYGLGFITANPRDRIVLRAAETGGDVEEYWRGVIPST